jgi:RNA polymerase sigma-70 factor (ECF subfamily)
MAFSRSKPPAIDDSEPLAAGVAARPGDPDRDIIHLVRTGDRRAALQILMGRHGRTVYRYCREALHDATLADDVLQQVFIQAYRDIAAFAGRATVRTWLFAIARHRVLDAAKSRSRAHAHLEDDDTADTPDPSPPPDERLDDALRLDALVGCVSVLAEAARTAVLLHYQQGFTFEEMAVICGEKPGTLQARVARALKALRACIAARTS